MLVKDSIFENIFLKKIESIKKIRIITGYTSGEFINFFIDEFSNIPIDIYIGMSQQGVKLHDHKRYLELSQRPGVRIYYQILGNLTHIKLVEIEYIDGVEKFAGSANFSFSGMFEQNELMASFNTDCNELFFEQRNRSISVLNPNVNEYIVFLSDEDEQIVIVDTEEEKSKAKRYKSLFKPYSVLKRRDSKFFSKFNVPLVTDSDNCKLYLKDGMPVIKFPTNFRARTKFPVNKSVSLYLGYHELRCKAVGKFNSELLFSDDKLLDFLNLSTKDKDWSKILLKKQMKKILFERINETEYTISF